MLFCALGSFRRCRKKMNQRMKLKDWQPCFFEHEWRPAVRIPGYVDQVVANLSLVYKERHVSSD